MTIFTLSPCVLRACAPLLTAVALTTGAFAQPAPLSLAPRQHLPARAPKAGSPSARALPPVPNGTFFPAETSAPDAQSWSAPPGFNTISLAAGTFTNVGPAPILGGQTPAGDPVSGRIAAIAVDPTSANVFYVAPAGGGVWKTTNGGTSFTPLTDTLPDLAMGALAVDPSNHNVVYAGTGEANFSGDSRYGIGVLKSTDGGTTWTVYSGPGNAFYRNAISRIVVDPSNSGNVYLTTAYAANGTYGGWGIWKSTNGGQTWAYAFNSVDSGQTTVCTDLAIDPGTPSTLYAAAGNIFGDSRNGIYKSTDSGANWHLLTGFPNGAQSSNSVGRITLALAPSSPAKLYAVYSNDGANGTGFGSFGGMYKTIDGGATWNPLSPPNFLGGQGWYDQTMAVCPTNAGIVFAAGVINYSGNYGSIDGIVGSLDGGKTWTDFSVGKNYHGPHTDHHALAFTKSEKLLNGNDGGVWRLENPTASHPNGSNPPTSNIQWTDLNTNLAITQFTGIALHPTSATVAYGGSQDNGTEKYTGSRSWNLVRGGDGGFVRLNQSNPQTVYHEYYGISLERSDDGGATWNGATNGINPSDNVPGDDGPDVNPANFYVPFILDPANQSRVLYGTDHVYESLNKGDQFNPIGSPGTNGFNPNDNVVDCIGVNGSTVYASAGGTIYVTTNDGASWTPRPISGATDEQSDIYVNPHDALDVIATRPRFNGAAGGHVFRSNDGGATWMDISAGLPDEPFNAVKVHQKSGTLYVGGDDGVYQSPDFGSTWSKASMPNAQVVDLAVSPGAGHVGAGTHGRSLFESPLPSTTAMPTLSFTATLTRSGGQLLATITLKNTGAGDDTGVVINSVKLNSKAATVQTSGANTVGTVPAKGTVPGVVYVCQSATSGAQVPLMVAATGAQGNLSKTITVTVP